MTRRKLLALLGALPFAKYLLGLPAPEQEIVVTPEVVEVGEGFTWYAVSGYKIAWDYQGADQRFVTVGGDSNYCEACESEECRA